jgi:CDP-6-deoxy-D-xylo-4-hexulose-3-dehydrase
VIEDCCEAHGAKVGDRLVGSFGDLGTFSFFFSHHITTMEGGMLPRARAFCRSS